MSDLKKIVILCILGLVLVGVFFYALSSIQEGGADNTDPTNEEEVVETTADTTPEEQAAPEQSPQATSTPTSTGPTYDPELPTSSDAGMEFPILE